jgi:hypothetical protein
VWSRIVTIGLLLAACGSATPQHDPAQAQIAAATALRGLKPRTPIRVQEVDRHQLAAILHTEEAGDPTLGADWDRTLHLLGVVPEGTSLRTIVEASLDAGVAGLYDPATRRLYVVDGGDGAEPSVIVHEATHALQDQWFGLGRAPFTQTADMDAALAAHALAEGDATDVQTRYLTGQGLLATLGEGLAALRGAGGVPSLPQFLQREQDFPYLAGASFIQALRAAGGEAAVNAAFRRPPRTTASVLDPTRYLEGDPAAEHVPVPAAPPGARRVIDTTFGAEDLVALTGESRLAGSWRGGRIVLDRGPPDRVTLAIATSQPAAVAAALRATLPAGATVAVAGDDVTATVS